LELHALIDLVRRGETAKVDFKAEYRLDVGDSKHRDKRRSELACDVAAIANTRSGPAHAPVHPARTRLQRGTPARPPVSIGASGTRRRHVA
jgi:hypothetical protein